MGPPSGKTIAHVVTRPYSSPLIIPKPNQTEADRNSDTQEVCDLPEVPTLFSRDPDRGENHADKSPVERVGGELQFSRIYSGLGAAKAETREAECGVALRSQAKPSIRSFRKLLLWACDFIRNPRHLLAIPII